MKAHMKAKLVLAEAMQKGVPLKELRGTDIDILTDLIAAAIRSHVAGGAN